MSGYCRDEGFFQSPLQDTLLPTPGSCRPCRELTPPRPWEGDVSRAGLGPELASSHVSCWSRPPAGRDVPTRVPIKSSWHSPGVVTVPTCIWLALERGAKFLQHKDQSTSVRQALSLGAEARQRHGWVYLPAGLLCGGWAAASPGAPQRRLLPTGERPQELRWCMCWLQAPFLSLTHPVHCTLVDR